MVGMENMMNRMDATKLTNPTTVKPTDNKYGNPWMEYFGTPKHQMNTEAYEGFSNLNYDMPEAYRGQNKFLKETITGFILQPDNWETTVALPFLWTDQLHFQWNEMHFDDMSPVGRTPHEGVSRLITMSKSQKSASSERRGLAFQLEHGFMNTPEGRRQYALNIKQIKQAVQQTCNYDVMSAILTCDRYDKEWEKNHGHMDKPFRELQKREVNTFAICQKQPKKGLELAVETYKKKLRRYGVTPNMMIVPSYLSLYMTMVPDSRTDYSVQGPGGPSQFVQGPSAMTTFRNIPVYEDKVGDQLTGIDGLEVDMLSKNVHIGEYYLMSDPRRGKNVDGYHSQMRDIVVYDEDADRMQQISFEEAIRNSHRFGNSGFIHEDHEVLADNMTHGGGGGGGQEDMFVYKEGYSEYKPCSYFGDMEEKYLTRRTVNIVVESAMKNVDKSLQDKINGGGDDTVIQQFMHKLQSMFPTHGSLGESFNLNDFKDEVMKLKSVSRNADVTTKAKHEANKKLSGSSKDAYEKLYNLFKGGRKQDSFVEGVNKLLLRTKKKTIQNALVKAADAADADADAAESILQDAGVDFKQVVSEASHFNTHDKPVIIGVKHGNGNTGTTLSANYRKRMASALKEPNMVKRSIQIMFLGSLIHIDSLEAMITYDVTVPVNILLVRPFMGYNMHSAILMKGGGDTGNTYVGHHDFQLGDDPRVKMHFGHYTFYSKAIVTDPRNIIIVENVASNKYLGGNGTEFLSREEITNLISTGMPNANRERGSLIALMVPYEEVKIPNPIDIRGTGVVRDQKHYSSSHYYNTHLSLNSIENPDQHEVDVFSAQQTTTNTVCFQGHQQSWLNGGFNHVTENTGHWGPNVYNGCGKVRDGEQVELDTSRIGDTVM